MSRATARRPGQGHLPNLSHPLLFPAALAIAFVLLGVTAAGGASANATQVVFGAVMLGLVALWVVIMVRQQRALGNAEPPPERVHIQPRRVTLPEHRPSSERQLRA